MHNGWAAAVDDVECRLEGPCAPHRRPDAHAGRAYRVRRRPLTMTLAPSPAIPATSPLAVALLAPPPPSPHQFPHPVHAELREPDVAVGALHNAVHFRLLRRDAVVRDRNARKIGGGEDRLIDLDD